MKRYLKYFSMGVIICLSFSLIGYDSSIKAKKKSTWNDAALKSMELFDDKGGYYTGFKHLEGFKQNAWEGMDKAYKLDSKSNTPVIDVDEARPSFCSSAIYMLLLKSLSIWNEFQKENVISKEAWVNLKPYTLDEKDDSGNLIQARQDDGFGCWGRANANGPGIAVLVNELDAGKNYYIGSRSEYSKEKDYYNAWSQVERFDFLKIFWNDGIGCDDNNSEGDERGHLVLFLDKTVSYDKNGNRDDIVYYWSSNGSKPDINAGYGIAKCRVSTITRAVATRITNPENFNNAKSIDRNNENKWLSDLNGKKHGTVEELKKACGIE
ncbi:hypothetical protein ACH36K_00415 [Clostridium sp. MB05]